MTVETKTKPLWHVGLRHENKAGERCPFAGVILGGHSFPLYTEKVSGYGQETRRDRRAGAYVPLDDVDMAKVQEDLEAMVVRWKATRKWRDEDTGELMEMKTARRLNRRARRFSALPDDTTMHSWVYMKRHTAPRPEEQLEPEALDSSAPWDTKTKGKGAKATA